MFVVVLTFLLCFQTADVQPGVEAGYYMERLRKLRAKCGLDTTVAKVCLLTCVMV